MAKVGSWGSEGDKGRTKIGPAGQTALAFLTRDARERAGDLMAMHKVGGGPRDRGTA